MKQAVTNTLVLGLASFTLLIGPGDIEAVVAPVAEERGIELTERSYEDGKLVEVCWLLKFKKLVDAPPPFIFQWKIKYPGQRDSQAKNLRHYPPHDRGGIPTGNTTKKGSERGFPNCAKIPEKYEKKSFTIFAYARYYVRHDLWLVPRWPERLTANKW